MHVCKTLITVCALVLAVSSCESPTGPAEHPDDELQVLGGGL